MEVSVVVVRLRRPSEMSAVVTTRRRRQPASCRALVVRESRIAQRGRDPQVEFSSPPDQDIPVILGPLFDELEGTGWLDAPVLALDATG